MHRFVALTVVCLLLVGLVHAAEDKEAEVAQLRAEALADATAAHKARVATQEQSLMEDSLAQRTDLFFRAMDADHDKLLSADDVKLSQVHLKAHMPSVTPEEFSAFIQAADTSGDGKLSHEELVQGLTSGLQGTEFLETSSGAMSQQQNKRWLGSLIKQGVNLVKGAFQKKLVDAARKVSGQVDKSQDGCVMCQYIVERSQTNVKQSGVLAAPAPAAGPAAPAFIEMEAEQNPFDLAASKIIGASRMSTRYQRQLERQKYNEIYRLVDVTLDDVCEQGMPNSFYGYCKAIYAMQSDVVDGLRYQYRPADICFRIGMCGKKSYITEGVHSRYRQMAQQEEKAASARAQPPAPPQ